MLFEGDIKRVLEVSVEYRTFALMPIRYPRASFGPGKRRLLIEIVAIDGFGTGLSGSIQ